MPIRMRAAPGAARALIAVFSFMAPAWLRLMGEAIAEVAN
jgi:hypothetical protein